MDGLKVGGRLAGWLHRWIDESWPCSYSAQVSSFLPLYFTHSVLGRVSCFNSSGFTILDKRGKYPQLSLPGHIRTNIQAHPHK